MMVKIGSEIRAGWDETACSEVNKCVARLDLLIWMCAYTNTNTNNQWLALYLTHATTLHLPTVKEPPSLASLQP